MKTVIYHSADYDGIFCREIAKRFLGELDVTYIGWNFGQPKVTPAFSDEVYVLDLSPDCLEQIASPERIIWIDHHKTSIEKWPQDIPGYRIDGVAACRLAWQWFLREQQPYASTSNPDVIVARELPVKQDFIDRKVIEPLAVRLAGEYDIWDKRDWRAETFQYALGSCDGEPPWDRLLTINRADESVVDAMLIVGQGCQRYAKNNNSKICKHCTWLMQWEGLTFLCVNLASFNSLLFEAKDVPETGHDALLGFRFDGKTWMFSLYHAKHRTDIDLSLIAVKHGGGGHRGACGFTCKTLPFNL